MAIYTIRSLTKKLKSTLKKGKKRYSMQTVRDLLFEFKGDEVEQDGFSISAVLSDEDISIFKNLYEKRVKKTPGPKFKKDRV